jgi:hypothetical protein
MLVLIDESGCTGFKPSSSTHFVIGMIIFNTFKDAETTANIITNLKKEVGFKREFRFNSCDNRKRDLFFEAIKEACFSTRLFVVEKRLIYKTELRTKDNLFINYCLKCLMKDGAYRIQNAVIKIDGKGSRTFRKSCESYLRKQMPPGTIKDIKFCDSKNDILIQLADMVVSAYSRPYNNSNKTDAFKWRNMIESKIENIWNFR